jgi:ferrochelatase
MPQQRYDALLIMSFGGPEGMDDVMPFLDNVLRGRNVPEERKREVAHHYELFGGVSPINLQNRQLQAALEVELERRGLSMPIYLANRNWHPFIGDVARRMRDDGVRHFLALVTSGFSCYSGCRQYREDIARALASLGADAPTFDKIRVWFNHPLFIEVWARHWKQAYARLPDSARARVVTLFTAHSIPVSMAIGCAYEKQLFEASRLTAQAAAIPEWRLVYQSRSGPPSQPWLEPDVCDAIRVECDRGATAIILAPIGFVSDHMEVLYDLDREAKELARDLKLPLVRASTPGTHPLFVEMLGELIQERVDPSTPKRVIGSMPPKQDVCPENCCPSGRPASALSTA